MLEGAALSWLLPDIVIRRKSGTAAIAQLAPTTNWDCYRLIRLVCDGWHSRARRSGGV